MTFSLDIPAELPSFLPSSTHIAPEEDVVRRHKDRGRVPSVLQHGLDDAGMPGDQWVGPIVE